MMRKILMTFALLFVVTGSWGTCNAHAGTIPVGTVVYHGNLALPEIALTFDDGPNPLYTPQILSILQQYGVHATFFTIGLHVEAYPQLVQQEYAAGHTIGDHSWNHPNLNLLTADQIRRQLELTAEYMQGATGVWPTFMRPPYGAMNAFVRSQIIEDGFTPVLWNIDTVDWQRPGSAAIEQMVFNNARNGAIVLMHDGGGDRSQTVAALPTIITGLRLRGFRLVTLQRLVADTY